MKKITIQQFNETYPTNDDCLQKIFEVEERYNNIDICPECAKLFKYYRVNNRKCYACAYCGHQLHP